MGTTGSARGNGLSLRRLSGGWLTCCRSRSIRSSLARPSRPCRLVSHVRAEPRRGIYTPGAARDHRYRVSTLREDFAGLSVLDVGRFDGFYAFLAEHRRADRVVAIDNEQYRLWVASRWGVEVEGGEGFRAVHWLLGSAVECRRMDAFALDGLDECFDVVYCFGILHRVENPLGLLRVLRRRTVTGGTVLVETYGVGPEDRTAPRTASRSPGRFTRETTSFTGGSPTPA